MAHMFEKMLRTTHSVNRAAERQLQHRPEKDKLIGTLQSITKDIQYKFIVAQQQQQQPKQEAGTGTGTGTTTGTSSSSSSSAATGATALTGSSPEVVELCTAIEAVLRHGLKASHAGHSLASSVFHHNAAPQQSSGTTATTGAQALTIDPVRDEFWSYVATISRPEVVQMMTSKLVNVRTPFGRGRAWVRLALNEKALESYFAIILNDTKARPKLYEDFAFIFDQELVLLLQTLISGLDLVEFNIPYDINELDNPQYPAPRQPTTPQPQAQPNTPAPTLSPSSATGVPVMTAQAAVQQQQPPLPASPAPGPPGSPLNLSGLVVSAPASDDALVVSHHVRKAKKPKADAPIADGSADNAAAIAVAVKKKKKSVATISTPPATANVSSEPPLPAVAAASEAAPAPVATPAKPAAASVTPAPAPAPVTLPAVSALPVANATVPVAAPVPSNPPAPVLSSAAVPTAAPTPAIPRAAASTAAPSVSAPSTTAAPTAAQPVAAPTPAVITATKASKPAATKVAKDEVQIGSRWGAAPSVLSPTSEPSTIDETLPAKSSIEARYHLPEESFTFEDLMNSPAVVSMKPDGATRGPAGTTGAGAAAATSSSSSDAGALAQSAKIPTAADALIMPRTNIDAEAIRARAALDTAAPLPETDYMQVAQHLMHNSSSPPPAEPLNGGAHDVSTSSTLSSVPASVASSYSSLVSDSIKSTTTESSNPSRSASAAPTQPDVITSSTTASRTYLDIGADRARRAAQQAIVPVDNTVKLSLLLHVFQSDDEQVSFLTTIRRVDNTNGKIEHTGFFLITTRAFYILNSLGGAPETASSMNMQTLGSEDGTLVDTAVEQSYPVPELRRVVTGLNGQSVTLDFGGAAKPILLTRDEEAASLIVAQIKIIYAKRGIKTDPLPAFTSDDSDHSSAIRAAVARKENDAGAIVRLYSLVHWRSVQGVKGDSASDTMSDRHPSGGALAEGEELDAAAAAAAAAASDSAATPGLNNERKVTSIALSLMLQGVDYMRPVKHKAGVLPHSAGSSRLYAAKAGALNYRGHQFKMTHWKQNFFLLQEGVLYHYRSNTDPHPKLAMPVQASSFHIRRIKESGQPFAFEVTCSQPLPIPGVEPPKSILGLSSAPEDRSFVVSATTEQQMDQWIAALCLSHVEPLQRPGRHLFKEGSVRYKRVSLVPGASPSERTTLINSMASVKAIDAYLYLFNDLLLVTTPTDIEGKFELLHAIPVSAVQPAHGGLLDQMQMHTLDQHPQPQLRKQLEATLKNTCVFTLSSPIVTMELEAESIGDRQDWVQRITAKAESRRVVGNNGSGQKEGQGDTLFTSNDSNMLDMLAMPFTKVFKSLEEIGGTVVTGVTALGALPAAMAKLSISSSIPVLGLSAAPVIHTIAPTPPNGFAAAALLVSDRALHLCEENLRQNSVTVLATRGLDAITNLRIDAQYDPDMTSYCTVMFDDIEHRDDKSWQLAFKTVSETDKFRAALESAWKALFGVELKVQVDM
ncbi:hypothetical protein CAOG_06557 [Capsaspora owczarzaki ATCC 30864]|uniref:PH domain-containing protein n=1 Tax=Capsaspora owczarzaki (strain ATCC 30864) TaxID=595528 RepID=A0A0D2X4K1_CAPO3|nr:hypothetical protein CAOG_06557 [Capsaspora owczarzaki ATCC 30864]KJE96199.1 hypothetical protein CAOG_006557 [Capsaspora owczarzaki ATCC 30864]|eukprot:XP_004345306.1 hypothetical protein CAOG_06557 [Capsaspora owczarzaki ATCC 30864]